MKKLGRKIPNRQVVIYYGNKRRKCLPPGFKAMYKITCKDLKVRSRNNIRTLSERFNIIWKHYYYYDVGLNNRSYIVYGFIGKERFTYHMYKHAGQNIGDVFLRYGNGRRIYCSEITHDKFPEQNHAGKLRETQLKNWLTYLYELMSYMTFDNITRLKIEKSLFASL